MNERPPTARTLRDETNHPRRMNGFEFVLFGGKEGLFVEVECVFGEQFPGRRPA